MADYKQLYIEMLRKYDENICEKCVNYNGCFDNDLSGFELKEE